MVKSKCLIKGISSEVVVPESKKITSPFLMKVAANSAIFCFFDWFLSALSVYGISSEWMVETPP